VTALTPRSGGPSSLVFIHGTNLTPPGTTCTLWSLRRCAVTVDFGTWAAFVLYASPTLIVALAPPGTGTVDVTVTAAGRTSATGPADRYTYISGNAARKTSVRPHANVRQGLYRNRLSYGSPVAVRAPRFKVTVVTMWRYQSSVHPIETPRRALTRSARWAQREMIWL
jgi:hypothetical protein